MKKLSFLSLITLGFLTLQSCADFPTTKVNIDFSLTLNANSTTTTFSSTDVLNANNSSDFDKYRQKINSLSIERVTYTINSSSLPAGTVLTNGKIEYVGKSGNATLLSLTNFDVNGNLGKELDIQSPPQAALEEIAQLLRGAPNAVTVLVSGTTNKAPIVSSITLKFYTKAVARLIGKN